MGKVFEKNGFSFFFYMNEHEPVHVHVMRQGKKAKIEIIDGKAVVKLPGRLSAADLKKATALAEENRELIKTKWHETFDK